MIRKATKVVATFLVVLGLASTGQAFQFDGVAVLMSPVVAASDAGHAGVAYSFQDAQRPTNRSQVQRETGAERPTDYRLEQNYPNPFNPVTMVRYAIPEGGHVSLVVFDALGQQVRSLVSHYQESGAYAVEWDGRDDSGKIVPSGLYLYRLETSSFAQTRRMMFVK